MTIARRTLMGRVLLSRRILLTVIVGFAGCLFWNSFGQAAISTSKPAAGPRIVVAGGEAGADPMEMDEGEGGGGNPDPLAGVLVVVIAGHNQ